MHQYVHLFLKTEWNVAQLIPMLFYEQIDGPRPERAVGFLHGILGRGLNMRTLARSFIEARPTSSAWLMDLRGHGRSPKGLPDPTLEATAEDVIDVAKHEALPMSAVVGHSFGGKVALEVARLGELRALEHVVVIDSVPGLRPPIVGGDSALGVIDTIESLPRAFASKLDFVRAVVTAGQPRAIADWLAGSVERHGDEVRFGLDLEEIRALLRDYFSRDLWPVVEHPPAGMHVHLMIADHSTSYSAADRERALKIAALNPQVTVDILPGGHWLHVDNPDGVLQTILKYVL